MGGKRSPKLPYKGRAVKILFYADLPVTLPYLYPLHRFIKGREPSWELSFWSDDEDIRDQLAKAGQRVEWFEDYDIAIVCDELSACRDNVDGFKICIFHGLASKGQAYSIARAKAHREFNGYFAVPSEYYRGLIAVAGAQLDRVFIAGLTKFDTIEKIPPPKSHPDILYAPTFNPELSAIPVVRDRIYDIGNVFIHLHAETVRGRDKRQLEYRGYYDHNLLYGEDITRHLVNADIVIADMGSTILEAMALGKTTIQVINIKFRNFYQQEKGLTNDQMLALPEVVLPARYGHEAWDIYQISQAVNYGYPRAYDMPFPLVENIGGYKASEAIYGFIKAR